MKWFKIVGLLLAVSIYQRAEGQTVTVTWTKTYQTIDGFGAYDAVNFFNTSSSVLQQLFSPTSGVGLSILRESVPDNSSLNNNTDPAGSCATVNSGCANISAELSYAAAQGVRIFATPWSPPASMKSNSSVYCDTGSGSNGVLNSSSYGAYATWLSNYIASLSQAGINLYALSVQNEPDTCPSDYGGATWTAADYDTFIRTNLGPTLTSAGQTSTLIAMPESGGYPADAPYGGGLHTGMDSYATNCIDDSSCAQYVSICATHDYEENYPYQPAADTLCANAGKRLWQTEVYNGTSFDGSMTDGLIWAQQIQYWLVNANANAWLWWEIFSPYSDNEPLYDPSSGEPSKRLFVIGQWSKFVRPGWMRIDATASPQSGVYVSAFKNSSTGAFAIIAVNTNTNGLSQTFSLAGFPAVTTVTPTLTSSGVNLTAQTGVNVSSNAFSYMLPGQSVTTFVSTASGSSSGAPVAPAPPGSLRATVE